MTTPVQHKYTRLYSAAPWGDLTGAPLCALEMLVFLKSQFEDLCLLVPRDGSLAQRARASQVDVLNYDLFTNSRKQAVWQRLLALFKIPMRRLSAVRKLIFSFKNKPGILHIHGRTVHLLYLLLAGKCARLPIVVSIHEPWHSTWTSRLQWTLIQHMADHIIFLTAISMREHPASKVGHSIIPYALPSLPDISRNQNATPVISFVASWGMRKGIDIALDILMRLKQTGCRFEAWLVGPRAPEMQEFVDSFILQHNLADCIRDKGCLDNVFPIYAQTDILLMTSRRDPYPRSIPEAMGYGIPVVASRVDGIPEMVIPGETGFLAPVGDVDEFTARLKELLEDPALRARMGAAAQTRAEKLFSADAYTSAMLHIYRDWM